MSANKLNSASQTRLLEWLCEGLSNAEVNEKLQSEFGVTIVPQTLGQYRTKWRAEIEAAEVAARGIAAQHGLARRDLRIGILTAWAEKCVRELKGPSAPGPLIRAGIPAELRATLKQLAEELGQGVPTKVELSGSLSVWLQAIREAGQNGGGPIPTRSD